MAARAGGSGKGKVATRVIPIAFICSTSPSTGARRISGSANLSKAFEKTAAGKELKEAKQVAKGTKRKHEDAEEEEEEGKEEKEDEESDSDSQEEDGDSEEEDIFS